MSKVKFLSIVFFVLVCLIGTAQAAGKGKPSIYGYWQQTEDSEGGFLGFEPKSAEVIVICKDGTMDGYAANIGIHMLRSDISIAADAITVKQFGAMLPYQVSANTLTMKSPKGKIMKYQRLKGQVRDSFISGVLKGKTDCKTEE